MSILKTLPSECQFFRADWWTPSQPLSYDDASGLRIVASACSTRNRARDGISPEFAVNW